MASSILSTPEREARLAPSLLSPNAADVTYSLSSPKLVPLSPPTYIRSENVPDVTELIQKNYELAKKRACDLKVLSNSAPKNHKNQIIMACNLYRLITHPVID